ncbi:MAG TPA: glycosyltransferase [Verrucomicrobiota bacterium]|nr:glycosyltransferase [Verrucomicrobiota bacterium]
MHVSVCICTFKRPELLKKLLQKIAVQETEGLFTFSAVVTDNDRQESARAVVDECVASLPLKVKYCCEPEQNIALARNRAVNNAEGDFIAFIDDDEFPPTDWLLAMVKVCEARKVAGVLAPVRPYFETEPPAWLVKGKFCERPEYETGYVLSWRETRTGNALFRRKLIEGNAEPFRRVLGNGGEDQDFFRRMMEQGHVFVWCNEAPVHEVVPPERWKRSYMIRRALLRGQNEKYMTDIKGVCKSLIAVPLYTLMLPFLAIAGHHFFMRYLIRLMDHTGKLMGLVGLKPLGSKYISG